MIFLLNETMVITILPFDLSKAYFNTQNNALIEEAEKAASQIFIIAALVKEIFS